MKSYPSVPVLHRKPYRAVCLALAGLAVIVSLAEAAERDRRGSPERTTAVTGLCERLGVGAGQVVADIGCGNGVDTLTFAKVVGPKGTVLAEEIATDKLEQTLREARQRQYGQVVPNSSGSRRSSG